MGKQYLKAFRRKILFLHITVSITVTLALLFFYFFADRVMNGAIVDFIASVMGWSMASYAMAYKSALMVFFYLLCIAVGFICVEQYAMSRLSGVVIKMGRLFDTGEERIALPSEFSGLEKELNRMKEDSRRHEREAQMEAQRKMDLITYLAHDIKTPLASVIGYLCLLDETDGLPEKLRKKYTGLTLEKAYRLENLINEFFDITRFNLSHIPLEKERIELPYMLAQMAEEFYPLLSQGGRSIELKTEEKLQIVADPNKLARVFNNILKNAIAYSYENSVILVEAYTQAGRAVIRFTNDGPVIPKEKLDQIFEKFFRLDPSRATSTGGSGLGLSIAREIVEQHRGTIQVESGEEKTRFTVNLPFV